MNSVGKNVVFRDIVIYNIRKKRLGGFLMSIDRLHNRIRKLKNPSVLDFSIQPDMLPSHLLQQEGSVAKAYGRFCQELMLELKDQIPAVRFSFGIFSMLGREGLELLYKLLHVAADLGYYVMLDSPEILSPLAAEWTVRTLCAEDICCDAFIISPYIGSDAVKPFLPYCKDGSTTLFAVVRSPNKSASELQDLLSGTRQVHTAAADMISRHGETVLGKCGYGRIGALVSAGSPEILRSLRGKYPRTFLLVDGLDYPSGNAKNCSFAFDRFGHGAVVCAGTSITAAWKESGSDGEHYLEYAKQAAERIKRNLTRYITIL